MEFYRTLILVPYFILLGCGISPLSESFPSTGSDSVDNSSCPTYYIEVPANSTLGTDAFCVAQFEMKAETNTEVDVFDAYTSALDASLHKPESRPDGIPWVKITQANAMTECSSLGSDFHLITAPEWAALSRNIESVSTNWSSGVVGSGYLYTNHSDNAISATAITDNLAVSGIALLSAGDGTDAYAGTGNNSNEAWLSGREQKRTLELTNGEVIWDLAGNAREKVAIDSSGSTISYTGPGASTFTDPESSTVSTTVSSIVISGGGTFSLNWLTPATSGLTDAANNVGQIYVQSNSRVLKLLTRGGNFDPINGPGIFSGDLDSIASNVSGSAGFRCVKSITQ